MAVDTTSIGAQSEFESVQQHLDRTEPDRPALHRLCRARAAHNHVDIFCLHHTDVPLERREATPEISQPRGGWKDSIKKFQSAGTPEAAAHPPSLQDGFYFGPSSPAHCAGLISGCPSGPGRIAHNPPSSFHPHYAAFANRPAGGRLLSSSQFCIARLCIAKIKSRSRSPKGVSEYSTCGRLL